VDSLRDRDLVRLHWPVELRPAFDALLDIDQALGDVVSRASQPALAAVKLAWWRDRLEELDRGQQLPEPHLQAAAAELLPRGIGGAELGALEAGWAELLAEQPEQGIVLDRGAVLFGLGARLLGVRGHALDPAGRLYAAGSLRRRGVSLPQSFEIPRLSTIERKLRPLSALAVLAKRDLTCSEPEATPARALALLRHRVTGRI
jgi:phytoene synthase